MKQIAFNFDSLFAEFTQDLHFLLQLAVWVWVHDGYDYKKYLNCAYLFICAWESFSVSQQNRWSLLITGQIIEFLCLAYRCVCLTFSGVQGIFNMLSKAELWCHIKLEALRWFMNYCITESYRIALFLMFSKNFASIKCKKKVLNFFLRWNVSEKDQVADITSMFVSFILYSTTAEAIRLSHFPISLPLLFMCCKRFPHFPAIRAIRTRHEVAEHFEIFRTFATIS